MTSNVLRGQGVQDKVETKDKRTLDFLEEFFAVVREVPSETAVHCIFFIAKSLGLLDSPYNFNFDVNVPLSPELELDLVSLRQKGVIRDRWVD